MMITVMTYETKLIFPKAEIPRLQITQSVRVCRSVPTLQIVKDPGQTFLDRIVGRYKRHHFTYFQVMLQPSPAKASVIGVRPQICINFIVSFSHENLHYITDMLNLHHTVSF